MKKVIHTSLKKVIDRTGGVETYIVDIVTGFGLRACKEGTDEAIYIQVYDTHEARSGDKRDALMEIHHIHPPNCSVDSNRITICIDLKNHRPGQPFHINVDWLSENTSDDYFIDKFIKNHPEGLNHMPIRSIKGIGKGRQYKIIRLDKTVDDILEFLRDQNVFQDFPIPKLKAFNPSCYKSIEERLTKLKIGRIFELIHSFE